LPVAADALVPNRPSTLPISAMLNPDAAERLNSERRDTRVSDV
jgi:hypothetical protein